MLTKYRVVIKVPHTGPVNKDNVGELLEGDKRLVSYKGGATKDYQAHQLALLLYDNGFRVNYTLMFEPYQTNMALQAKPYYQQLCTPPPDPEQQDGNAGRGVQDQQEQGLH